MIDVVFDYSKLRGKIKEVFGTQTAFAAEIPLRKLNTQEKEMFEKLIRDKNLLMLILRNIKLEV